MRIYRRLKLLAWQKYYNALAQPKRSEYDLAFIKLFRGLMKIVSYRIGDKFNREPLDKDKVYLCKNHAKIHFSP